jgi:endonuclease G, mitochondrial
MTTADLRRTATLDTMVRLGGVLGEADAPGSESTTPAASFARRNGYNSAFLSGWTIPLPRGMGVAADDMRRLRRGGRGVELKYRNFSVIMSASRRLPMITATNIDGSDSRNIRRDDRWGFDGRLDKSDQFGEELYDQNPLDRGHMVRRLDPVWGPQRVAAQANADTFHYTNACPQKDTINQGIWNNLEDYILSHALSDELRVNVFTGPYFSVEDVPHDSGALIPLAFWKVVAIVTEDGRPSATAYEVSQEDALRERDFVFAGFKTYQISVQQVIDRAQIDFRGLVDYDGFSHFQNTTGQPVAEALDSLEQIRV